MYRNRVQYYLSQRRKDNFSTFKNGLIIVVGATLVAVSLQLFLVKNYVIDGGIVGLSIILSHVFHVEVGALILLFNLPFLVAGFFFLGGRFLVLSLFASSVLAGETYILAPFEEVTNHPLLIIILGGLLLGMGVGLIIRFGACLDGTEVLAILFSERLPLTIGQCILIMNTFIFGSSVFLFGITEAAYSLATFFVAYKTIDTIIMET
ncbi:putative 5xTM membrane YitT family protein [Cytobacillus firmus]|uniref:Putative 5xTM membrane YitT family protein n=2 Tax=Cytobacillus TaxID=2675230 RepID=A0A366K2J4_CYTFI|nr:MULTISPECIES: YitT family protein [Cytobacillus]RBP95976.1 putative 5xTM membrane YitT family protein [Cytobacillus firmus]TDX44889.1 putative 5xTM membrane YitT family protein [Cytobacillus oceanisediminis]